MPRVVAVVYNDVSMDARVCRAADTLVAAGHEVHIVGLRTSTDVTPYECLPNGAQVHRLERPDEPNRRKFRPWRRFKRRQPDGSKRWSFLPNLPTLGESARRAPQPLVPLDDPDTTPVRPASGAPYAHLSLFEYITQHTDHPQKLLQDERRRLRQDDRVVDFVSALQPDVVHANDLDPVPACVQVARDRGIPVVFDAHEVYDQLLVTDSVAEARRRRLSYLIAHHAPALDGFVTLTDAIADYYTSTYAGLPEPTIVANAAPSIADQIDYDGRLHEAAGFSPETRILLYQGRYSAMRCLAELIASAEHLPANWGIVTLGYAAEKHRMEANRNRLPPSARSRVAILDAAPQAELPLWTAGATLGYLALPKTHLNYVLASPNRLWSYPQANVPILGTSFTELERVRDTYGAAFIIKGRISGEAIGALVRSIDEQALERARAGCAAFMTAEGWEHDAARLRELVERLTRPGYVPRLAAGGEPARA